MCKYCEEDYFLLDIEVPDVLALKLGGTMESKDLDYDCYSVFIDRGYLRYVSDDDSQCLDHGERIKINYCPMCGGRL